MGVVQEPGSRVILTWHRMLLSAFSIEHLLALLDCTPYRYADLLPAPEKVLAFAKSHFLAFGQKREDFFIIRSTPINFKSKTFTEAYFYLIQTLHCQGLLYKHSHK